MPDTTTPNLSLTQPQVGGSTDTWGTKINADLAIVDALFQAGPFLQISAGGTGAGNAAAARSNLGVGSIGTQNANAVNLTGGTIAGVTLDGTPIGASIPSTVKLTTLTFNDGSVQTTSANNIAIPTVTPVTTTGTTSAAFNDLTEACDCTGGSITRTLYTAIGNSGKRVTYKKLDATANILTIQTVLAQTIDAPYLASATLQLARAGDAATLQSNGANWILV